MSGVLPLETRLQPVPQPFGFTVDVLESAAVKDVKLAIEARYPELLPQRQTLFRDMVDITMLDDGMALTDVDMILYTYEGEEIPRLYLLR
ncbi:hypothetical protein GGF42_002458 [Coemansia sp. RSA 2424]|nr:hypothetical protein GGF42_002458 [Coemansia sp. RSA 2424]